MILLHIYFRTLCHLSCNNHVIQNILVCKTWYLYSTVFQKTLPLSKDIQFCPLFSLIFRWSLWISWNTFKLTFTRNTTEYPTATQLYYIHDSLLVCCSHECSNFYCIWKSIGKDCISNFTNIDYHLLRHNIDFMQKQKELCSFLTCNE